ncbi:hypothetical protein [Oleidesulfovibrio alaskensis]|jgi:hypothetical protein|uniref:hypothetical protein n=1 Tax=Oleidesulfovibrio alaskensis TaxID=58180 RepID=UPI001A6354A1|nr:hypothetical protein [Oleidesulfovibrio alaskensis]MBL3583592.1 hypothetical protein [Oleidesulfovibrio alaskensis]
MLNIISYSLYGRLPKYLEGAVRNAEAIAKFWPEWKARFYVGVSVPDSIREKLTLLGAEIVLMNGPENPSAMFWRFQAFFDPQVSRVLIRDADSRLTVREQVVVNAWLASGKEFHIVRDHPFHQRPILGGLWGGTPARMKEFQQELSGTAAVGVYDEDQQVLAKIVYPKIKKYALIHDSFFWRELTSVTIPHERTDCEFLGEAFDELERPDPVARKAIQRASTSFLYRLYIKCKSLGLRLLGK